LPTVPPGVGTGLLIRTCCVRVAGRQPFRPVMRQVSQPSCLLGESGSLPLQVANLPRTLEVDDSYKVVG